MSKFFQALEKAEKERALQKQKYAPEQNGAAVEKDLALDEERENGLRLSAEDAGTDTQPLTNERLTSVVVRAESHLVSIGSPGSFEAEQYRALCHMVEQLHGDVGLSVIAISSPMVGDGKTTTAINMAGALTRIPGCKVLLVDLDLRHPSVAVGLGLNHDPNRGVVDIIQDSNLSLENGVRICAPLHLAILPAGAVLQTPYDALKSPRLDDLIEEARKYYDYIILDTPPVLPFPDCRLIERFIDGFLVVVAAHKTPRKFVEEAIDTLDPDKLVGLVFNNDDQPVFGYYSYYSYGPSFRDGRNEPGPFSRTVKKFANLFRRESTNRERAGHGRFA